MPIHGKKSKFQIAADRLIETNDWSVDVDGGVVDIALHQLNWMLKLGGIKDWNGSVDAMLNMDAGFQTIMQDKLLGSTATGTFRFYINATSYYSGEAYIESMSMGAPAEDSESITFNLSGNGTLAYNAS